ncbi:HNH endonuclease signature motif containing protein [Arthrobacter sp. NtRootA1]|uniref:HNH endonuclease signature motif containing protein n=1 Tax=Arthrobacter sp. NtRootA1 TaxID=2830983 RepID=UPI001CC76B34|nr:HNH endonuclease signature motif containing protein [Arthrobacter sp. NtRootA1]BCW04905.1 hypothetical protein NtRootA1_10430 [Arthrobacter sp. NtRootA1]
MGSIGEILARRAAVTGATLRPRRVPLGSHSGAAHGQDGFESPTAAVTGSDSPRAMALLRGIKPLPVPEPDETDRDAFPGLGVSHGLEDARGIEGARGIDGSLGLEGARGIEGALADSVEALEGLRSCTVAGALSFGFAEAAGFAGRVEEISRTVEYLQVIAAHAVERTRTQAQQARPSSAAGTGWQTGWTDPATTDCGTTDPAAPAPGPNPATAPATAAGSAAVGGSAAAGFDAAGGFATAAGFDAAGGSTPAGFGGVAAADAAAVADDGYRDAAQFLRARLRIGISEARRRLALASEVLPRTGIAGQHIPARREILAQALESTQIPTRSASIISAALDKVRLLTDEETLTRMEHALTATAIESDPDFVLKMTKRWNDLIDQDGPEPSEEILRQLQGTFIRKPRHGLHHLEIFATTEQYETLTTAMNTAANPRLTTAHNPATGEGNATGESNESTDGNGDSNESTDGNGGGNNNSGNNPAGPELDRRSRAQKLLDGLVGACAVAMTTGKLPANGGLRPQVMVTINHHDLFQQLTRTALAPSAATPAGAATTTPPGSADAATGPGPHHSRPSSGTATPAGAAPTPPGTAATRTTGTGPGPHRSRLSSGAATFAGPIHPNTIRKIACDADILPVLLGTDSRILDIGRTTRIFPPHIRKAITARDQGCAFPDCTMPAPWCEAHHITYWSHGGTTSTDNGTLLCSHHHHLIHKENWTITTTTGVPWFTPPPHIDPHQTPRRNHHHTPLRT